MVQFLHCRIIRPGSEPVISAINAAHIADMDIRPDGSATLIMRNHGPHELEKLHLLEKPGELDAQMARAVPLNRGAVVLNELCENRPLGAVHIAVPSIRRIERDGRHSIVHHGSHDGSCETSIYESFQETMALIEASPANATDIASYPSKESPNEPGRFY